MEKYGPSETARIHKIQSNFLNSDLLMEYRMASIHVKVSPDQKHYFGNKEKR